MNIRVFSTMFLVFSAFVPPERASAYSWDSEIGYDTDTITLSGYSRTWKDPADWDIALSCIFWEYDIDFGFYCSRFLRRHAFPALQGEIYRLAQGTPVFSEYTADIETARTDYAATSPAGDVWTAQADHYVQVDNYLVFCCVEDGLGMNLKTCKQLQKGWVPRCCRTKRIVIVICTLNLSFCHSNHYMRLAFMGFYQ